MNDQKPRLTYNQKTFGAQNDWAMKKMKTIVTNPEGTLTLRPFDDQPNKLSLIVTLFPETVPTSGASVLKVLKNVQKVHGECPDDENFWVWWVTVRGTRVSTLSNEFVVIQRYLQLSGYYSKSFKPMFLNYRLYQRDGVKKADVILTEEEIAYVIRKVYPLDTAECRAKQKALDTFVLALFSGARMADVRNIVKSTDAKGQPILMYHNRKGTRSQSVAWNPAVEGALERGLYKTQIKNSIMYAALKMAMYECLPSSSNRLINYYFLKPGRGRELKTDGRISHITFHAARHTFCTRLLRIGVSVHVVAQLAGHKNIQTTMRYYNWMQESEANDVLRGVYGAEAVVTVKPEWGEGAKTNPLPVAIHAAQLPQPQLGTLMVGDGGLKDSLKKARSKVNSRPRSSKHQALIDEIKRRGLV